MDWLALLSLAFLLCAIVTGILTKINTGVVAIVFALVLGKIGGITETEIISGFNYSLFLTLAGITFLFSIAQINGTLEQLAKRIVLICGRRSYLMPIVIYFFAAVLSAIGPGTIPVASLMAVITVSLALQMKIEPIKLAPFGILGACAGGISPIAPTGIIAITFSEQNGIKNLLPTLPIYVFLGMSLFAVLLYFIFKWHKVKAYELYGNEKLSKFTSKQLITLAGIILMILLTLLCNINVGLSAFSMSVILLLFRAADEKKAFTNLPIGTLFLVTGVGMLVCVVQTLGGIQLLSDSLAAVMSRYTAAPFISLTAGMISWFASGSGVTLPTLIPTIPSIAAKIVGINTTNMVIAICIGSHAAALSPLTTLGALVLASYTTQTKADSKQRSKVFTQLFALSIIGVIFVSLLTWIFGFVWQ